MDAILTSAIITYNQQDTIERCIKSVLEQKTEYPYRIEIWDDCSTDETSRICADYARRFPEKIVHVRQSENTFCDIDKNHVRRGFEKIKTKYFHTIDGDDYLIDEQYFQDSIAYLESHEQCSIFAACTCCKDLINNVTSVIPALKSNEARVSLDDFATSRFIFVTTQVRVYRNTYEEIYPADTPLYLYHLTKGYCQCINRISAVYNVSGSGIWSELNEDLRYRLNNAVYYRMIQYYGLDYEKVWIKGLHYNEQNKIKRLKRFLGTRRAWDWWFKRLMVPVFGKECLDRYWNYVSFTRRNRTK